MSQRRICRVWDGPARPCDTFDGLEATKGLWSRDQAIGAASSAIRLPEDPRHVDPPGLVAEPETGATALERDGVAAAREAEKTAEIRPQTGVSANSCTNQPARFKNDVWTCDFIHDRTAGGRPLKWLTLVDEYTRECLVLHADSSLTGADVRRLVARVIGRRGAPTRIRSDNGSEFICAALVGWLPGVGAKSIPVAAGSPWENGYIESFHSRLRDEFLEREEFESVADARAKGSWFRREYNTVRPHSSLGYATPKEFSAACDAKEERKQKII